MENRRGFVIDPALFPSFRQPAGRNQRVVYPRDETRGEGRGGDVGWKNNRKRRRFLKSSDGAEGTTKFRRELPFETLHGTLYAALDNSSEFNFVLLSVFPSRDRRR